jgi:hypothetical protein
LPHCSTQLSYIIRQAPFAVAHLRDQDLSIDFSTVTTPEDRVAVIATVPLTDNECWTTMPNGSLWLFEEGAPVRHQITIARARDIAFLSLSGRSGIRLAVRLLLAAKPLDCRIHLLGRQGRPLGGRVERRFRKRLITRGRAR